MNELNNILGVVMIAIEFVGVMILVLGFLFHFISYLTNPKHLQRTSRSQVFRVGVGRVIIIGLEVLVAATIVKTIILEPSLQAVGQLAGMIVIRTIIGWTISTEMSGHWPWQSDTNDKNQKP